MRCAPWAARLKLGFITGMNEPGGPVADLYQIVQLQVTILIANDHVGKTSRWFAGLVLLCNCPCETRLYLLITIKLQRANIYIFEILTFNIPSSVILFLNCGVIFQII